MSKGILFVAISEIAMKNHVLHTSFLGARRERKTLKFVRFLVGMTSEFSLAQPELSDLKELPFRCGETVPASSHFLNTF